MPGISRVSADHAGGTIVGVLVGSVHVNGSKIAVKGAAVAPHPPKKPPIHQTAVMAQGSGSVKAGGIPVCRAGDSASCGHSASGSGNVNAG